MLLAAHSSLGGPLSSTARYLRTAAHLKLWCWEGAAAAAVTHVPVPALDCPPSHDTHSTLDQLSATVSPPTTNHEGGCGSLSSCLHHQAGSGSALLSGVHHHQKRAGTDGPGWGSIPAEAAGSVPGCVSSATCGAGHVHSQVNRQGWNGCRIPGVRQHAAGNTWPGVGLQQHFVRTLSHQAAGPGYDRLDAVESSSGGMAQSTGWEAVLAEQSMGTSSSSPSVIVGSSMEDLAWEIFGPTQMGIQTWEMFHLGLGVPWWISIPATTLTIKLLLLPLTLKAKAASANFALAQQAWTETGQVAAMMDPQPTGWQRWGLYLRSYRYLRKKYRTPPALWYTINSLIQIPLFITLSLALRRMSAFSWPGLTNEGTLYFPDLTSPAVDLANWTTPYGPVGVFIPLALLSLQMLALDYAAAARSPPLRSALELSSLTYFLAALSVPHATLLYWLTNSSFHVVLQHALSKPDVAKRLGLPMLLVNTRSEKDGKLRQELEREEEEDSLKESLDVDFLLPLGEDTLAAGNTQTALACFEKVLQQEPNNIKALLGKSRALYTLQRWQDAQVALDLYKSHTADTDVWTSAYQQIAMSLVATAQNGKATGSKPTTSPSADAITTESAEDAKQSKADTAKLEAAVQLLQHVTAQKPGDMQAWLTLGAACSLMGRTVECLKAVDKAYSVMVGKEADEQDEGSSGMRSKLEALLQKAASELKEQGQPLPPLSPEASKILSDAGKDEQSSGTQPLNP